MGLISIFQTKILLSTPWNRKEGGWSSPLLSITVHSYSHSLGRNGQVTIPRKRMPFFTHILWNWFKHLLEILDSIALMPISLISLFIRFFFYEEEDTNLKFYLWKTDGSFSIIVVKIRSVVVAIYYRVTFFSVYRRYSYFTQGEEN